MQNDMRNRLVELLGLRLPINVRNVLGSYDTIGERTLAVDEREKLADYLLANGVILPPCKVGDSIFRVCGGEIWEWIIAMAYVYPEETIYVDDSENEFLVEDIGKTVFLTKEDAEEKLKEISKNG